MNSDPKKSHRTDVGWRFLMPPAAILTIIGAFLVVDLATDHVHCEAEVRHQIVEGVAALGALGGAIWVLLHLQGRSRLIHHLTGDLAAAREEAQVWRQEAAELLRGLSAAIDDQFSRWELTQAEREVALLLLKGLSTRDIAIVRATREATVRQQAQGVYRKAGMEGRAELAAFFLEDLLAPRANLPGPEAA